MGLDVCMRRRDESREREKEREGGCCVVYWRDASYPAATSETSFCRYTREGEKREGQMVRCGRGCPGGVRRGLSAGCRLIGSLAIRDLFVGVDLFYVAMYGVVWFDNFVNNEDYVVVVCNQRLS